MKPGDLLQANRNMKRFGKYYMRPAGDVSDDPSKSELFDRKAVYLLVSTIPGPNDDETVVILDPSCRLFIVGRWVVEKVYT